MSDEIEDLIASISEKFDTEFNVKDKNCEENAKIANRLTSSTNDYEAGEQSQLNPEKIHNKQMPQQEEQEAVEDMGGEDNVINGGIVEEQNQLISHEGEGEYSEDYDRQEMEQSCSVEQEEEEQEENRYKDLSLKLETALRKISSSKKGFMNFQSTNKSFNQDILIRFEEYQQKREKQLQKKRRELFERNQRKIKEKPCINEKSKLIATEINQRPIYERFDKILEDKKKKMEENEGLKKQRMEKQYEAYLEEFNKHQKVPDNMRDPLTYYEDMLGWKKKLEDRRREEKQKMEQNKDKDYTFTPTLNKKSEKIVRSQQRVPVQDREIEILAVEPDKECTFKPKINKRILR